MSTPNSEEKDLIASVQLINNIGINIVCFVSVLGLT